MITKEDHLKILQGFEVDRLLKLLHLEAKKNHDGHYAIFSFTTHFKVAFGTPDLYSGASYAQINEMPGFPRLKDAIINALVEGKTFYEHFDGTLDEWHDKLAKEVAENIDDELL